MLTQTPIIIRLPNRVPKSLRMDLSMKKLNQNSGFSMTEVVVAAVIFAISVAGFLSTSASLRQPGAKTERRLQASYIGKQVLEDLRVDLNPTNWTGGSLAEGTFNLLPITANGIQYRVTYTVTSLDPSDINAPRKVDLTISWDEPS